MSKFKKQLDEAIESAYKELSQLAKEEFQEKLKACRNTNRTKVLLYASNNEVNELQYTEDGNLTEKSYSNFLQNELAYDLTEEDISTEHNLLDNKESASMFDNEQQHKKAERDQYEDLSCSDDYVWKLAA